MLIWPTSATLAEDGSPTAGLASPMTPHPNAGEILLSRAESAALAALETEDDEAGAVRRAQAESGLNRQQIEKLRRRAAAASSKGYTLKGMGFIKKPLASTPDEPGLTRKAIKGKDEDEKVVAKGGEKKSPDKTKEANAATLARRTAEPDLYTCPNVSHGIPFPGSMGRPEESEESREANTMTTLAAMLRRRKRKRSMADRRY